MINTIMKLFISKEKLFELMTYKVTTSRNIEDVVANVEKICEANKFALLHDYVYHDIIKSKGFSIDKKVYIYEICQAKVAALVLNEEPSFTPFMPCRIAIYEEGSHVRISTQNMELMLNSLDRKSEIFVSTSELFSKLKFVMNEIKG